jgi:hypothetical protein
MSATAPAHERRTSHDRRRSVLGALWRGNFARRRIAPRRRSERFIVVTDWFHPQWLAVVIGILLLCGADALFTLKLISHGASELNPFMDPLVRGSGHSFAFWKFGLTSVGVLLLTLMARLHYFGRTVGVILYVVLAGYVILVGYEVFLLRNIPLD